LCGADYNKIIDAYNAFQNSKAKDYPDIFGDGKASQFILRTILENVK